MQNGLPTTMVPIDDLPSTGWDAGGCGVLAPSFRCLAQLFTLLDDKLIELSSPGAPLIQDDGDNARNMLSMVHSSLLSAGSGNENLDEAERVNIVVTQNWTRVLWWEYALRHFALSSQSDDQAFSMMLPASVAREMLGFFASTSRESVRAHGYGLVSSQNQQSTR